MRKPATERMQAYWDERARLNAAWYVDTSLSFDNPDMDRFFADGERIVAHVLQGIRDPGSGVALEIGCGLGRLCRALATRFDRVIGVDISPEMIARARELVPECEFKVNDGADLEDVPRASVDLVLTFTVFQHIPDQEVVRRYVAEIGRVLRPGGSAYLQWNASRTASWSMRRWVSRMRRPADADRRFGTDAPEFQGCRIEPRVMSAWLDEAGLEISVLEVPAGLWAQAWVKKPEAA